MKMKKAFGALALLLALTAVGCGSNNNNSSAPASSSKPASSQPSSSKPSSSAASQSSSASSSASEDPLLTPLVLTYTEGTPAKNSSDKDYIPLTDTTANKVGVKISIQNYTVEGIANDAGDPVTETTSLGSDGKIAPGNDHKALLTFKVKAPKAGDYQLVMRGKASSSHLTETLDDRAFYVRLNGVGVNVEGNRAPFAGGSETIDFVAAPTITLTGNEDAIMIGCSDYRVIFDVASYLIFAEH